MKHPPVHLTDKFGEHSTRPGHKNRVVRLRYATVQEHFDQLQKIRATRGTLNVPCPISDFFMKHLDTHIMEFETLMLGDPDFGSMCCCEPLMNSPVHNNAQTSPHGEEIAKIVQHDAMLAMVEYHTWEQMRAPLENALRDRRTNIVSPEAWYIILSLINKYHPNPRRFLEQDAVRSKLPPGTELERFAASDFDQQGE